MPDENRRAIACVDPGSHIVDVRVPAGVGITAALPEAPLVRGDATVGRCQVIDHARPTQAGEAVTVKQECWDALTLNGRGQEHTVAVEND